MFRKVAICRRLLRHCVRFAASRALLRVGRSTEIKTAMIPMTTRSSTRVKAARCRTLLPLDMPSSLCHRARGRRRFTKAAICIQQYIIQNSAKSMQISPDIASIMKNLTRRTLLKSLIIMLTLAAPFVLAQPAPKQATIDTPSSPLGGSPMVMAAPPPATALESFGRRVNSVVIRGYTDVASLRDDDGTTVRVIAVEFTDLKANDKAAGLA